MLLKYFYDSALAHASYLVGCQQTGEAIVVDPGRDIEQYLAAAKMEGMKIVGAAETHIHADYVSGVRELADRVGAKMFVSDEGPADWKYLFATDYDHQLLKDGDAFSVGKIEFEVMHTPGHTPESVSFLLTDKGGGANRPMGIFTGDFVFVGSIGRPDLLEEAAGIAGSAESGARDLFRSLKRFRELPDFLQVWPAHGAGSACGKGLGAIPSSTVGYEKLYNPALQYTDEQAFVDYVLAEQPEAPKYFAIMKRVNKEGPTVLGESSLPKKLSADGLAATVASEMVIDTAAPPKFAAAHFPGTINVGAKLMGMWGGSVLDYDRPLYLISGKHELEEVIRVMRKIGIENIAGYFDADEVAEAGLQSSSIQQVTPGQLAEQMKSGKIELVDVRGAAERQEASIAGSQHVFLGSLQQNADRFDNGNTYAFYCRTGGRSMIGASIAERAGAKDVLNLVGGMDGWKKSGLPFEQATVVACGPGAQ